MKPSTFPPSPFELPQKLPQRDLEIAWLGCIFHEPAHARSIGLCGLDQSFFGDKEIFEIGLCLLRDLSFEQSFEASDEILLRMCKQGFVSTIDRMLDEFAFLPRLYRMYCDEIEARGSSYEL